VSGLGMASRCSAKRKVRKVREARSQKPEARRSQGRQGNAAVMRYAH
jgi:hypothetical protein